MKNDVTYDDTNSDISYEDDDAIDEWRSEIEELDTWVEVENAEWSSDDW